MASLFTREARSSPIWARIRFLTATKRIAFAQSDRIPVHKAAGSGFDCHFVEREVNLQVARAMSRKVSDDEVEKAER